MTAADLATLSTTCMTCHNSNYSGCPECEGERIVHCLLCNGTGKNRETAARCLQCGGDGKTRCLRCNGVGEIRCPDCRSTRVLGI